MKHVYDKGDVFKYTPASATDADYLREKFRQIRERQEKEKQEHEQKVKKIVRKI